MKPTRLEAFSDGVIAIIITIMVLELKESKGSNFAALKLVLPSLASYVISFIFVGIYWNNHHHLIHVVKQVNGGIMWANLNLLFWLSLVPFVTNWVDENHFEPFPVAVYAGLFALCGLAYNILQKVIEIYQKDDANLQAIMKGQQTRGIASFICYVAAIPLAYISTFISAGLFLVVATMWIIPDRKIEQAHK